MDRTGLDSTFLEAAGLDWIGFTVVRIRTGLDCFKRIRLTLFRDDNGLLRVGRRIGKASIAEEAKHPIIPQESELARLIIMLEHIEHGYAGVEHNMNEVRQSYWITQGRSAVKKQLRDCAFCHRRRTTPMPPRMADLPRQRHEPGRPFKNAGIGFFEPLLVKWFSMEEVDEGVHPDPSMTQQVASRDQKSAGAQSAAIWCSWPNLI